MRSVRGEEPPSITRMVKPPEEGDYVKWEQVQSFLTMGEQALAAKESACGALRDELERLERALERARVAKGESDAAEARAQEESRQLADVVQDLMREKAELTASAEQLRTSHRSLEEENQLLREQLLDSNPGGGDRSLEVSPPLRLGGAAPGGSRAASVESLRAFGTPSSEACRGGAPQTGAPRPSLSFPPLSPPAGEPARAPFAPGARVRKRASAPDETPMPSSSPTPPSTASDHYPLQVATSGAPHASSGDASPIPLPASPAAADSPAVPAETSGESSPAPSRADLPAPANDHEASGVARRVSPPVCPPPLAGGSATTGHRRRRGKGKRGGTTRPQPQQPSQLQQQASVA